MKSIFAFFVLNIAFITTMFAQINPYTNFRFYSDTRFIKDWGFCVAIPESMVESSDPRVQLLFKMDRGFEDKYSGSMVLLKFYDWDGKSTAQQITDLDNPEPYRKCIIGTKSYAAKAYMGQLIGFKYVMINYDEKTVCKIVYFYPPALSSGNGIIEHYISESYIDQTQNFAQKRAEERQRIAKIEREQAIRDSIATAIEREQAIRDSIATAEANIIKSKIEPSIKNCVSWSFWKGWNIKYTDKNDVVKITYDLVGNFPNRVRKYNITFANGEQINDFELPKEVKDSWSDDSQYHYLCKYGPTNDIGIVKIDAYERKSGANVLKEMVFIVYKGNVYKIKNDSYEVKEWLRSLIK